MRYYVVWPDGQRFGPAEVDRLNEWVVERRIGPATMLQEEATGRTVNAQQVPGLNLYPQPSQAAQTHVQQFNTVPQILDLDDGSAAISLARNWLTLGAISGMCALGCMPLGLVVVVFPILALLQATKAAERGHPAAESTRRLAIGLLVAQVVLGLGAMVFIAALMRA